MTLDNRIESRRANIVSYRRIEFWFECQVAMFWFQ